MYGNGHTEQGALLLGIRTQNRVILRTSAALCGGDNNTDTAPNDVPCSWQTDMVTYMASSHRSADDNMKLAAPLDHHRVVSG